MNTFKIIYNNFPIPPEIVKYANHTVLAVIKCICKNKDLTFLELLNSFPDSLADHGGKFMEHPYVIKKQVDITKYDKEPKIRYFQDSPVHLKKENIYIVVSNQWNYKNNDPNANFAYFCRAAKEHFNIDIEEL